MKLLLDTHVLLWAAGLPERLTARARSMIEASENVLVFSAASLWEVAIKRSLNRSDFHVDPRLLRRTLLDNGYMELPISSAHAVEISVLPDIHKDPFDRILLAQALAEGILLLTADSQLAAYPAPVMLI